MIQLSSEETFKLRLQGTKLFVIPDDLLERCRCVPNNDLPGITVYSEINHLTSVMVTAIIKHKGYVVALITVIGDSDAIVELERKAYLIPGSKRYYIVLIYKEDELVEIKIPEDGKFMSVLEDCPELVEGLGILGYFYR